MEEEFGNNFKASVDEPRIYIPNQTATIVPTPMRITRGLDRFDKEPAQAPNVVALKRAKLAKSAERGQLLFKKSSYQNTP